MSKRTRKSKIPKWYSSEEMYHWLRTKDYSHLIAEELSVDYAVNLQRAFVKGWTMGVRTKKS